MRTERLILDRLEKAVHSGNITEVVPEDLEPLAYNTQWDPKSKNELTLMKLLPSVPATSVVHEYTRVTSYGRKSGSGFFNERALPPETNFQAERVEVEIRLMGEIGPTFLLAALEKTQRALNTTGAQNIERVALRRNVLYKKNRNLYFADTRTTSADVRFKGLYQLIEEGTDPDADGFSGVKGKGSPYGSHVIDCKGAPLTTDLLRERFAQGIVLFGAPTCMIMSPMARADFEATMDPAQRLAVPTPFAPIMIGQDIGGIHTQNGNMFFNTDNVLSAVHSRGQYDEDDVADEAPKGLATVNATAGADGSSDYDSVWDAASAGQIFYAVRQVADELAGKAVRFPASNSAFLAVAADQEVTLTLTPSANNIDSFMIYRGREEDGESTTAHAWFIFEVANDGGGAAVTAYDDNRFRPNTEFAYALNIHSDSQRALNNPAASGTAAAYHTAAVNSGDFFQQPDSEANTVAVAELGPSMGMMALASVLAEVDRPLIYSACAPEMRNPFQNFVFKNVGRAA